MLIDTNKLLSAAISAALLVGVGMSPGPAAATIVADCGSAGGKVFYVNPSENAWRDDAITGGRVLIDALADGNVNVIFRDAMKRTVNVTDDGGYAVLVARNDDWSQFTVTVAYPETGAVETYMLTDKGGEKLLLWSTIRPGLGPIPPKVSAYVSKCE